MAYQSGTDDQPNAGLVFGRCLSWKAATDGQASLLVPLHDDAAETAHKFFCKADVELEVA